MLRTFRIKMLILFYLFISWMSQNCSFKYFIKNASMPQFIFLFCFLSFHASQEVKNKEKQNPEANMLNWF